MSPACRLASGVAGQPELHMSGADVLNFRQTRSIASTNVRVRRSRRRNQRCSGAMTKAHPVQMEAFKHVRERVLIAHAGSGSLLQVEAAPSLPPAPPPRPRRITPAEAAKKLIAGAPDDQPAQTTHPRDLRFLHVRGFRRQPLGKVRARLLAMHIASSDVIDCCFLYNGVLQIVIKQRATRHILACLSRQKNIRVSLLEPAEPDEVGGRRRNGY